jgi:hypothetical protein
MKWRYKVQSHVLGVYDYLEFDERKTEEQVSAAFVEGLDKEIGSQTAKYVKRNVVVELVHEPDNHDPEELEDNE